MIHNIKNNNRYLIVKLSEKTVFSRYDRSCLFWNKCIMIALFFFLSWAIHLSAEESRTVEMLINDINHYYQGLNNSSWAFDEKMTMQNEGTQTILNTKEGNVHYNSDKLWYQWTSIQYPDQKKEFCEQSYDGKTWIKLTKSSEIEDMLFLRSIVDISKMPYDPHLDQPLLFLFGYLPQFNNRT